jgi:uncharacterized protein YcgI (DUF1989 family)
MMMNTLCESTLQASSAVLDHYQPAGEPWLHTVKRGQILRIVDLEGNQAVDTIFYNADDPAESYSVTDTLLHQGGIYLSTGSVLMSNRGQPLLTIVADTCGRHDTLGGACAAESNTVRYSAQKNSCTAAATTICWHSRMQTTAWANATWCRTSISS